MTEQERFLARFNSEASEGLVDIKFFVVDNGTLSPEAFYADLNDFVDSIDAGKALTFEGLGSNSRRFEAAALWD